MSFNHDPSRNIVSRAKDTAPSLTLTALLATGLAACSTEEKPVVTLTKTQHDNLKHAGVNKVDELLSLYSDAQIHRTEGSLWGEDSKTTKVTGEVSGSELKHRESDEAWFRVELAANGAQLTVERSSVDYCVDPNTDEIANDDDCPSYGEYIDSGYQAVYTNPDTSTIDVAAPLNKRMVKQFIKLPGTYLSSIGDEFELDTALIDSAGNVTEDEDGFIRLDEETAVDQLSDMVNRY